MRSRKGCPQCRRQRIKCDEQQPQCGQCQKRNRECNLQDSVFKQHTFSLGRSPITAARRSNAPHNLETETPTPGSTTRLLRRRADKEQDTPLRARNQRVYADIESVSSPQMRPLSPVCTHESSRLQDRGRIWEQQDDSTAVDSVVSVRHIGSSTVHHESDEHWRTAPDPNQHRTEPCDASNELNDYAIEALKETQEELFLLRHYSECIAPWMDHLYQYEVFSREVLLLAREHPILRYAACALAAKQLGQMRNPVSTVLRGKTQERIASRLVQGRMGLGFVWYGIKYYEKAIQTLVKSITPRDPQSSQTPMTNHSSPAISLSGGDLMVRADREDPIVRLLGTCILIQYEQVSANRDAWSGHLTGFSKLLDLIEDGVLLHQNPLFEQVYPWTKDIMEVKAGFWNFVVNDLEESLVSQRRTRIDTENFALWRNMGLLVEDDGRLTLTSSSNSLSTTAEHARNKVLSYTLIRLLCKLVDYLAPATTLSMSIGSVANDEDPVRSFVNLENQLDAWHDMLSPSFHPDGTFTTIEDDQLRPSGLFTREIWFSNDFSSTTMMYYHMARLLLLIHRPPGLLSAMSPQRASFDLIQAFRETETKMRYHACEVISIVRGTPCDSVKLRAIQPLYIAGRCCSTKDDRKGLLELLTGIQDSLGIATGYRVKTLLKEWGVSYQDFGMEERLTTEEKLG